MWVLQCVTARHQRLAVYQWTISHMENPARRPARNSKHLCCPSRHLVRALWRTVPSVASRRRLRRHLARPSQNETCSMVSSRRWEARATMGRRFQAERKTVQLARQCQAVRHHQQPRLISHLTTSYRYRCSDCWPQKTLCTQHFDIHVRFTLFTLLSRGRNLPW